MLVARERGGGFGFGRCGFARSGEAAAASACAAVTSAAASAAASARALGDGALETRVGVGGKLRRLRGQRVAFGRGLVEDRFDELSESLLKVATEIGHEGFRGVTHLLVEGHADLFTRLGERATGAF